MLQIKLLKRLMKFKTNSLIADKLQVDAVFAVKT